MKIKRICKVCGTPFIAIKTNQFFCSRNCFKRDYYVKNKIRVQNGLKNQKFPSKHCNFCDTTTQLDFDPIKYPDLLTAWKCPKCSVNNKILWKYEDHHNSHRAIEVFLAKHQEYEKEQVQQVKPPQYQIYHIPILIPEQCASPILTMACDIVSADLVRKRRRKKIFFLK